MRQLRLALGMPRQTEQEHFAEYNTIIQAALQEQLASGQTALYGHRLTYQRMKQCGIPVGRNRMFEILRTLDPSGISERRFAFQKTISSTFKVPGVNHVLSVDGDHNMSAYEIEIYAGIDVYCQ